MRTKPRLLIALTASVALLFTAACTRNIAGVSELSIADAARAHGEDALFVDANTPDYRADNGKVPGAVLLGNYRSYDAEAALGPDRERPLVFYCSSRL